MLLFSTYPCLKGANQMGSIEETGHRERLHYDNETTLFRFFYKT